MLSVSVLLLLSFLLLLILLLHPTTSTTTTAENNNNVDDDASNSLAGQVLVKSPEGELVTDEDGNVVFHYDTTAAAASQSSEVIVSEEQAIYAARAVLEHLQSSIFGTEKEKGKKKQEHWTSRSFKTLFMDKPVKYPPSYQEYANGLNAVQNMTKLERLQDDELARERRDHVREAMEHSWNGYKKYAWGKDELRPVMKLGKDNYGGMGVTLVDSLDTLWLMGMKDEFYEARDWVRDHLDHDIDNDISVFETTIRSLGGLLAAYDLSGDEVFLERADDLGNRLVQAFDSPSGIPYGVTNMNKNISFNMDWTGGNSILAELGTLQIEFRFLAKATGKAHYAEKADKVFELMKSIAPTDGLYPIFVINEKTPKPGFSQGTNKITFGAMGDSFYEYMLKIWLQGM